MKKSSKCSATARRMAEKSAAPAPPQNKNRLQTSSPNRPKIPLKHVPQLPIEASSHRVRTIRLMGKYRHLSRPPGQSIVPRMLRTQAVDSTTIVG